jgi:hypothetical protein
MNRGSFDSQTLPEYHRELERRSEEVFEEGKAVERGRSQNLYDIRMDLPSENEDIQIYK